MVAQCLELALRSGNTADRGLSYTGRRVLINVFIGVDGMKVLYIVNLVLLLINIILSPFVDNWSAFLGWICAFIWCFLSALDCWLES